MAKEDLIRDKLKRIGATFGKTAQVRYEGFCTAVRQNVKDEAHDKEKYAEAKAKYPKFAYLFGLMSDEEHNHEKLNQWMVDEVCK